MAQVRTSHGAASLRVALVQLELQEVSTAAEKRLAIDRAAELIRQASDADLFVLPELAPVGYSDAAFAALDELAEDEFGPAVGADCRKVFAEVARERNCFVCYGTIGRRIGGKFGIRQVVLDNTGSVAASYDKCHLCDFGDCAETLHFTPGTQLAFFECRGWRVGLLICADMRYTELSRELVIGRGCDILVQPAAFARDVSFASWPSFVECRALENQVYWAGVNYSGQQFGGSIWCPPWVDGDRLTASRLGIEESVRIFEATREELDMARRGFAFRRLRRERTEYDDPVVPVQQAASSAL